MSTLAHTVLNVQQFLTKNSMAPTPHHAYSPKRLLLCLFLCMEEVFKGKHLADVEELKQKMTEALKGIKIDEFKNCFEE